MNHPLPRKCLIANRGEIAVRIIRACRELEIKTVAVYSEVDENALHVLLADEAYAIGAASPAESYLNSEKLIAVAQQAGCDCVHPGYGFLSESADFAQAVLDAGLLWVGPPPEAIRKMGSKTEARELMQQAGVPLVPGFQSESATDADFLQAAQRIGYPVMIKAAGGGGGKGIRIVHAAADLTDALAAARREAVNAFGDPRLFLEKYIEQGRHIEVQVLADTHGHTIHLYERECSTQRRHQKIIEESPSPLLNAEQRAQIGTAAVQAAEAVGYTNAGTVEFITTADGTFYFLEMNTRLQVEHPVTEMVTGLDLVQLQFRIAAGEALSLNQNDIYQQGHAIECRVYAEDPPNQFLPAIGPVVTFIPPQGPGIRVDAGVQSGDKVTIHYDPMIAKLIVHAPTRTDAIRRMQQALAQTVILGITTNIPFLQVLLEHPAFVSGEIHTGFVDTHLQELLPAETTVPTTAIIIAALHDLYNRGNITENAQLQQRGDGTGDLFSPWSRGDSFRQGQQ